MVADKQASNYIVKAFPYRKKRGMTFVVNIVTAICNSYVVTSSKLFVLSEPVRCFFRCVIRKVEARLVEGGTKSHG